MAQSSVIGNMDMVCVTKWSLGACRLRGNGRPVEVVVKTSISTQWNRGYETTSLVGQIGDNLMSHRKSSEIPSALMSDTQ